MQLMYLMSITAAARSIDLSAAYFVPDELTHGGADRGHEARRASCASIVPGEHIDSEMVRSASRARWGPLLQAGALIAEYQPTMYHCKVLIVDGLLVSVGSTNFDNRSFRLNDEASLNVLDAGFAARTDADLRGRSRALAQHQPGRMARPPAAREADRTRGVAVRLTAVRRQLHPQQCLATPW